jgi:hypothetical protein
MHLALDWCVLLLCSEAVRSSVDAVILRVDVRGAVVRVVHGSCNSHKP